MKVARRFVALVFGLAAASSAIGADRSIANIPLTAPFGTRTLWHFSVTQSEVPGEAVSDDPEPGVVIPCLHRATASGCDPVMGASLNFDAQKGGFDEPHYLRAARIAYRQAGDREPLLIVVLASLHSGDGDQLVGTQAFAYRRDTDQFVRVFGHVTGTNNNQEVRFIDVGPLRGAIITAVPTADAPFGYWITVARSAGDATVYQTVLRYRSSTHYNDGNELPVIDSEMPQVLHRLSLWRPGQKLPLPASPCPKPRLNNGAFWCS